jgi:hypothetical protein
MRDELSPRGQFARQREDQIVAPIAGKPIRPRVVDDRQIGFELRSQLGFQWSKGLMWPLCT